MTARPAVAGATKVPRATENAPIAANQVIEVASKRVAQAYGLEAHIPAEALSGFDPDEHRRIGLYFIVEDVELGQHYLTVGDDLNWYIDPSTWATAVLVRE